MRFSKLFSMAAAFTCVTSVTAAPSAERELHFGSVAMDIPTAMHRRMKPVTDYLTRELGRKVTLKLSPDLSNAADDGARGNVEIAPPTPSAYIKTREESGVR